MKLAPIAEMTSAEREDAIAAFLRDDAELAADPRAVELLEVVADAWSDKAGDKRAVARIKPGREAAVLDVIMSCAYTGEGLDMSLARLARAVGYMGLPYISAFTAHAAYHKFPHLTEKPYHGRRSA